MIQWVETRDAVKHPTQDAQRSCPATKNYLAPNRNTANTALNCLKCDTNIKLTTKFYFHHTLVLKYLLSTNKLARRQRGCNIIS
jgi:hypothetical protein